MKKYTIGLLSVLLIAFTACNQTDKKENSDKDSTANRPDTTISKTKDAVDLDTGDVSFMENAAYGGMVEVESSNKILQASADTSVKTFAQMMVTDHTTANNKLKQIAQDKGYNLPTVLPISKQLAIKKMDEYKQEQRDEYYIQLMIAEHQNAIDLFSAASRSHDATISNFAKGLLPTLKHHYQHTLKIDTSLKAAKANQGDDLSKISNRKKQ